MKKNFDINIALLNDNAKLPSKQHDLDIGYDLYSLNEFELMPKKVTFIETGISIELPAGCGGFILPRSGLASKYSITSINSPGLIDPGYTGEIKVPLINHSDEVYYMNRCITQDPLVASGEELKERKATKSGIRMGIYLL